MLAVWDPHLTPGALLIGLAVSHRDAQPIATLLQVGDIERHQLRSAEPSREPHYKECSVPKSGERVIGAGRQESPQLSRYYRCLLGGGGTKGTTDALHGGANQPVASKGGRVAGQLVCLGGGGESSLDSCIRRPKLAPLGAITAL